jgi:hypothetical protein
VSGQGRAVEALQQLAVRRVLTVGQLGGLMGLLPFMARGLMRTIAGDLGRAGLAVPFTEEDVGADWIYRWREAH